MRLEEKAFNVCQDRRDKKKMSHVASRLARVDGDNTNYDNDSLMIVKTTTTTTNNNDFDNNTNDIDNTVINQ